jgi:hypothetical protein
LLRKPQRPTTPYVFPDSNRFYLLDLGEVRLDPSPISGHRWRGSIEARGSELRRRSIDWVGIVPVKEGYGTLKGLPLDAVIFANASVQIGTSGISALRREARTGELRPG